jgi:two-component system, NarL family, sensor kinase
MYTQQTPVYTIIIIAGIIIGIIIIYFLVSVVQQQRKYQERFTREIESEINTLENERKRIAADLHDDLGPILSATKMKLNSMESIGAENEEHLSRSMIYIDNLMGRIREIAKGLMPTALIKKGPVYAVEEYINSVSIDNSLKIDFYHNDLPAIPDDKGIHLYRILQEIIHNTIKHSGASSLIIELAGNPKELILSTADNGKGFSYFKSLDTETGSGLKNIKSRVHILGGDIHVKSEQGFGTSYYIILPLA